MQEGDAPLKYQLFGAERIILLDDKLGLEFSSPARPRGTAGLVATRVPMKCAGVFIFVFPADSNWEASF